MTDNSTFDVATTNDTMDEIFSEYASVVDSGLADLNFTGEADDYPFIDAESTTNSSLGANIATGNTTLFDEILPDNSSLVAATVTNSTLANATDVLLNVLANATMDDSILTNSTIPLGSLANRTNTNSTFANSTYGNSTLANSTDRYISHFERRCPETDAVAALFGFLSYHLANALLALAFVVPKSAKLSALGVRGIATAATAFLAAWSLMFTCANDLRFYTLALVPINCGYLLHLLWKHFPVFIPKKHRELFNKVFEPLNISEKYFKIVTRDASLKTYRAGPTQPSFAIEKATKAGKGLHILLSGKLAVKCDDIFLHFVTPFEFVDSIEWKARESSVPPATYQVTIDVVTDATIMMLPAPNLHKAFAENRDLKFLMNCLIGKDITRKLYMMNENVANHSTNQRRPGPSKSREFRRTNSVDAVHTGCKGLVRSEDWRNESKIKDANDSDHLMVLNYDLDVPPSLSYLPHRVAVNTVDRATMAEAHFIAQQRKYWPVGIL